MKRPLSLIEVTIGLTLTAILLTALFSSFRHLMQTGVQIEIAQAQLHPSHLFELRITRMFESLSKPNLFYTMRDDRALGNALFFSFDNGLDKDPEYCGELDALLFVSNEKNHPLCLLLKGQKKEIFFDKIDQSSFQFFNPKKNDWETNWKNPFLPPMIKITLNEKTYSFVLPHADHRVTYHKP